MTELQLTPELVLVAAAADCETNWCRGTMEEKGPDGELQHCMLGAINVAAGVPLLYYSTKDWNRCHDYVTAPPFVDPDKLELRDAALALVVKKAKLRISKYSDGLTNQQKIVEAVWSFNDFNDQEAVVNALLLGAEGL